MGILLRIFRSLYNACSLFRRLSRLQLRLIRLGSKSNTAYSLCIYLCPILDALFASRLFGILLRCLVQASDRREADRASLVREFLVCLSFQSCVVSPWKESRYYTTLFNYSQVLSLNTLLLLELLHSPNLFLQCSLEAFPR